MTLDRYNILLIYDFLSMSICSYNSPLRKYGWTRGRIEDFLNRGLQWKTKNTSIRHKNTRGVTLT